MITNPATNTAKEQGTLPYGTALDAETTASTNQKFTSYDRSDTTGLDYAVNRIYSSEQARFLQPDPIGMASVDLTDPQTFNLYTYARNNPIDLVDPSGTHAHNIRYFLDGFEVSPETFFSMVLSGSAVPPGGYSGALGNWERFGETGRRFVPNSLYIHGILNRLEPTSPVYEGDEGLGDGYPGGDYNKVAQLAPCPELIVPNYEALSKVASMLLQNTYGEGAAEAYGNFSTYQKAVFVNTVVAAAGVGANFSSAKFLDFYRADYGYENGIYVEGLGSKGTTRGRHEIGGSVEFEREKRGKHRGKIHIDVDLYHSGLFSPISSLQHLGEYWFNKKHKRGTHPWDVVKRLAEAKVNTGVSCKRE